MSTQAERLVRIESEDGRRHYAMSEAAYKHNKQAHLGNKTYEDAGYKVVSYEDGTVYEAGKEPTRYGIHAAAMSPEIGAVEEPAKESAQSTTSARSHTPSAAAATPTPATEEARE
jgi:hypothetical protein